MVIGFPGTYCLFLEDGTYISSTVNEIQRIGKNYEVIWKIPGLFHHQLALTPDKQKILALNSEVVIKDKKRIRIDKLMMISLKGEVLHEALSDDLLRQAKVERPAIDPGPVFATEMKVDLEVSHFNSFYEIPKLKVKSPLPEMKEGNFIVNGRGDGLFILSPDLKTLLRHINLPQSLNHQVHDAQILEDGRLLIFNNLTKESNSLRLISSIQEIDLAKNKIVFEFTGTPKGVFYTKIGGAVQKLDEDNYLLIHPYLGSYIYSKKRKDFSFIVTATNYFNQVPFPAFVVRLSSLESFFKEKKMTISKGP
jgi:hypothetical protein